MISHSSRRRLSEAARKYFRREVRENTAKTHYVRQDAHFINWGPRIDGEFKIRQREICAISLASKSEPDKWRQYYVGRHVAQDLIELAGETKLLPLSDLSKSFAGKRTVRAHADTNIQHQKLTPLNRELADALDILIDLYRIIPREGGIFECVKIEIQAHPDKDVAPHLVKNFGKGLSNCGKSLSKMLADVQARVPNPRDFSFPLLTKAFGGSSPGGNSPPPSPGGGRI